MSIEAPNWYVTQYQDRAIYVYQAKGNLLRGMTMEPGRIHANTVRFMIAGRGEAVPLVRGSFGPAMNAPRNFIDGVMQSWQANDWVFEDDLEKITVNEMEVVSKTAGQAIGRRSDLIVINEMNAQSLTTIGDGTAPFDLPSALTGCQTLQKQMSQWDGGVYCGLPSLAWNQFLSYKQVSDADWTGYSDLPYTKVTSSKFWNGVTWFLWPDEYSPVPAANQQDFFMWHRDAIGYGINYDLRTTVTWENLYSGWYHNNRFSATAKTLLPGGMLRFRYKSNSPITVN